MNSLLPVGKEGLSHVSHDSLKWWPCIKKLDSRSILNPFHPKMKWIRQAAKRADVQPVTTQTLSDIESYSRNKKARTVSCNKVEYGVRIFPANTFVTFQRHNLWGSCRPLGKQSSPSLPVSPTVWASFVLAFVFGTFAYAKVASFLALSTAC